MAYTPNNPNGQATKTNSAPVVLASDQGNLPTTVVTATPSATAVLQNAAVATGNGANLTVTGYGTALVQILGTFVATISFEVSSDAGVTWDPIAATKIGASTVGNTAFNTGQYRLTVTGFDLLRARVTWTSGTSVTINARATNAVNSSKIVVLAPSTNAIGKVGLVDSALADFGSAANPLRVQGGTAGFSVTVAAGAAVIGALTANQSVNAAQINGVAPLMGNGVTGTGAQRVSIASDSTGQVAIFGRATGGATSFTLISAATTNATLVKASAGTLFGLNVTNNGAAARYLKLYNLTVAPTVGTSAPVMTLMIPAGGGIAVQIPPQGINFSVGISYALTAGITLADTAAVAVSEVAVNGSFV